jgi:hypothetical protein
MKNDKVKRKLFHVTIYYTNLTYKETEITTSDLLKIITDMNSERGQYIRSIAFYKIKNAGVSVGVL